MATKKASPAQLAARKKFVEMVRSGAFKKRKTNPQKKTVSQKISQLTHEGYPQKQAVAVALSRQSAGKVKKNPQEIIAGQHIYKLGDNYFARISLTGYNDYYAVIFKKGVEYNGLTFEDVVPDYKPRHFVTAKAAVASVMRYATKNLKTNPTKQRSSGRSAVMQNPVKNKRSYTVYCQAPGQSIHSWTKLATFYSATGAKQYANAYAKMYKSHYVRVESHG